MSESGKIPRKWYKSVRGYRFRNPLLQSLFSNDPLLQSFSNDCKNKHLHSRWARQSLHGWAKNQSLEPEDSGAGSSANPWDALKISFTIICKSGMSPPAWLTWQHDFKNQTCSSIQLNAAQMVLKEIGLTLLLFKHINILCLFSRFLCPASQLHFLWSHTVL